MQSGDDIAWLHAVRGREFEAALAHFPADAGARVLEIGSGTGYLLAKLRSRYAHSAGLEVRGSAYDSDDPDIVLYDGRRIPAPDNTYDVVFSCHVLEHVAQIESFVEEIARVLKPGGLAIHILPSPTWRILTSVFHYFALVRIVVSLSRPSGRTAVGANTRRRTRGDLIRFMLYAPRHGEHGSVLTEPYYFSRSRWRRLFAASSLAQVTEQGLGFVYWGRDLFRLALPFRIRAALACVVGPSSNLYVLQKASAAPNAVRAK